MILVVGVGTPQRVSVKLPGPVSRPHTLTRKLLLLHKRRGPSTILGRRDHDESETTRNEVGRDQIVSHMSFQQLAFGREMACGAGDQHISSPVRYDPDHTLLSLSDNSMCVAKLQHPALTARVVDWCECQRLLVSPQTQPSRLRGRSADADSFNVWHARSPLEH